MSQSVVKHAPKWGPLGEKVYNRTYQRPGETWEDTVRRVVNGNCNFVGPQYIEKDEREKLFDLIYDFKLLPGGRHLWATGIREGKEFINNCFVVGFDRNPSNHFTLLFDLLMQGGGVGANYSNRYLDICAPLNHHAEGVELRIKCDPSHPDYAEVEHHVYKQPAIHLNSGGAGGQTIVADSREGWVNALRRVFWAHQHQYSTMTIDVSQVRCRGSEIKGFGGIACGPGPLVEMLVAVNEYLNKVDSYITGYDAMCIDHEIARCVVSGGVRRSSRMAMKSWLDDDILDFIHCKSGGLNHWTTNISVEIDDEFFIALNDPEHPYFEQATQVMSNCVTGMLRDGEPGFFNRSLASINDENIIGTNPCGEITLESGEACILGHVNLSAFDSIIDQLEAFRLMTRFLIRATFAKMPNEEVKNVVNRNRRIGVGFLGYQEWCLSKGIKYSNSVNSPYVRESLRLFKEVVDQEKRAYADQLKIPVPVKGTCVAPTGSISNLPGVTGAFQTIYRKYFKRRIRYQDNHPEFLAQVAAGAEWETDVTDPSGHTKIIVNYCKDNILDSYDERLVEAADEVPLETYLAIQAMVQRVYADNAISFTINIPPEKILPEQLEAALRHYLPKLKGTTIFPDLSRPQPPFEKISKEEYEAHHGIVSQSELECLNGACPIR